MSCMSYKYTRTFSYEGKRYYVRGNTLEEIAGKIALKKRDLEDGKIVTAKTMTVALWVPQCIRLYKRNVSDKTLREFYRLTERVLIQPLGGMRLSQVKPMHLQEIINEYEGMSASQVNAVYHALTFVFGKAKLNGMISADPSEGLVKPYARAKQSRRALTAYEREHVIAAGFTKKKYLLFMLMLFCGCRPTEAANATGADITEQEGYPVLHIRGTKTALSDRFVPIPDTLYGAIKNTPKSDFIATYANGNRITKMNRSRLWAAFCRDVNLSMGCKTYRNALVPPLPFASDLVPYCLRHEYCTELARRGVDIRIAQRLMGHSTIRMTANVYTNLQASDIMTSAEAIGATKI